MASSRKKQDEKNLKTLRELGALPQNKYCFDCNQRGPTYVNVTIGSFVCTKCSGMLRGLTPPHRVKSISMATFTTEEVDLLKNRGNDYCKKVWLGLYDKQPPGGEIRDDQTIRDFMVDKYEKKRYYLDPAQAIKNGLTTTTTNHEQNNKFKPLSALVSEPKPLKILNGNTSELRKRPEVVNNKNNFIVNFDNADIFSNNNNNIVKNGIATINQINKQEGFANFEDNPVFNNSTTTDDDFSIFDLKFTNSGPILNQVPLFPKCNNTNLLTNRWSVPMASNLENFQTQVTMQSKTVPLVAGPPSEDRYAALKDLDNALKSQNTVDWNSSGSNGSLYSSPTPSGSMYSSPSPQNSMFGSPSQGFLSVFNPDPVSNPFNANNTNGVWTNNHHQATFNPFRDQIKNGFNPSGFQNNFQPVVNGQWAANPFKVIGNGTNSTNNPFL